MLTSRKPHVLFEEGNHRCISFNHLVSGDAVQSNQFVIINGDHAAVLDPGGDLTYAALSVAIDKEVGLDKLTYVIASHQDPDIIASLQKWQMQTKATVICSALWARFLPHLYPSYMTSQPGNSPSDRIKPLEDKGANIPLGDCTIKAIPAHFLHSVGNFQFFDCNSRILFSGDMAANLVDEDLQVPVEDFQELKPFMEGFHRRYMCSKRACKLWADEIRKLAPAMIVPQHGRYLVGQAIPDFLDWISVLDCGVDLLNSDSYKVP